MIIALELMQLANSGQEFLTGKQRDVHGIGTDAPEFQLFGFELAI